MHAAKPTGQIVEALRTSIKQGWERLTEGIVAFLAARGVTPNQVSFAGLFVTILVLLRLEGVLALPIVLFMLALIVVAEVTLSAER